MINPAIDNDESTFTYDCESKSCENYKANNGYAGVEMPDSLFPTPEQVAQGMDGGICIECNRNIINDKEVK